MKAYELHLAESRASVFASLPQKVWLESDLVRTWVVAEAATCAAILRHPDAVHPDLLKIIKFVEKACNIELTSVRTAYSGFPPLLDGPLHAEARKCMASFLSNRLNELDGGLPAILDRAFACLKLAGEKDIFRDVIRNLVGDIVSVLIGRKLTDEMYSINLSDIFPLNKSAAKMIELDADFAKAISFVTADGDNAAMIACKLSCLVFGMDSLAMLLTEGILLSVRSDAIAVLPEFPVETGVPVTFRRARETFCVGKHEFRKGDMIRLQLQSLGYSYNAALQPLIFGAGAHSCIGKQTSLRVWTKFRERFNALNLRARLICCEYKKSHFIALYDSAKIEVLP